MKGALWIIRNWQMSLLAMALICVMVLGVYWKGRADERQSLEAQTNKQSVEDVKQRTLTRVKIQRMPKNEVQRLLEEKWCRDCQ